MRPNKAVLLGGCLLATGLIASSLHAQDFDFTTIAGGSQGSLDGDNLAAQFYSPAGVVADGAGNVYVADENNNLIRKLSPLGTNWIVSTIAGSTQGSLDGANSQAQFFGPTGIAMDSSGNLYVTDQYNDVIRKITPSGTNWVVSTIAGTAGVTGRNDGANGSASFSNPTGLAVDGSGEIFVADEVNNAIRKITPAGTNWVVTTIAGGTLGASDGTNTAAQFYGPFGVAVDGGGRVFVADQFNNTIRLITPVGGDWVVTTVAGQPTSGFANGLGTNACFDAPVGLAVDSNDHVYVADLFNNAIRILSPSGPNWMVSTIGGGSQGSNNGIGPAASFDLPIGVAADAYGDVYVADLQNNAIRLGLATNSPAPTGSVQVMMTPSGAIAEGATWQLDGSGPWLTTGAVASGLAPGNHTVNFSTTAGFTTPAVQTIPVTVRQTNLTTGHYAAAIANAGSLQVNISPAGSVDAGAQWQVDGGPWQSSGAIVAGLSPGTHTLSFSPVAGWTTVASQSIIITNAQTTLVAGTYLLQTGSLQAAILPSAVIAAGAQWNVDGGTFQSSGTTLTGLLPGSHTVSYNIVLGWKAPVDQIVTIAYDQTTTNPAGIYVPNIAGSGALQVALLPAGAVQAGALWQIDGRTGQAGGIIVSNLTPGLHSLTFTTVAGWTKPGSQAVEVTNGQTTLATGTYVQQAVPAGSLQATILPAAAAQAGAQWQVDGSAAMSAGVVVSNLAPGSYFLTFTPVAGWTTPAGQTVDVTNGQTTLATGTYEPPGGSIQVTILPAGAVTAKAQWQVDGGAYQNSGAILGGLTPGSHVVTFNLVTGWIPPVQQPVTIVQSQVTTLSSTYLAGTEKTLPVVTITAGPAANAKVTQPVAVFSGKASDKIAVDQVLFQLNHAAFQPTTGTTNWLASLALTPGANTFAVEATDSSGNVSTVLSRSFLFIVAETLTLTTTGGGKVAPPPNGGKLDVGMPYVLTATPNTGSLFSNWSGSLSSATAQLAFTMQSNMVLQANFVPNPFLAQQGAFNGLFYDTNGVAPQSSGFLGLTLAQSGAFTVKIQLNGASSSASGQFDLTGHAALAVARAAAPPLALDLQLDFNNHLSGAVSAGTWNASLAADLAVFNAVNNKAGNYAGQYTMAVAGAGDGSLSPEGAGYATFSVSTAGSIVMVGALADGTAINQTVALSGDGQWPFYVALAGGGSVFGWITFSNQPASTLGGALSWIRPAGATPKLYTAGFTNLTSVIGSSYHVTAGLPSLALTSGQATLSGASLDGVLTNSISINNSDILQVVAGSDGLALTLTKTTGLITGTFKFPVTGAATPVHGVILQAQSQAQGFWLGSTQSGAFLMQSQ